MGKRGHFTLHFTDKDFKLKLWKEHPLLTTQLRCVGKRSQYGQMLTATMQRCSEHHLLPISMNVFGIVTLLLIGMQLRL